MNKLILLFGFLLSNILSAQVEGDSLITYFNQKQFVKSHKLLDERKKSFVQIYGKENTYYLSLVLYEARVYYEEQKYYLAKECFEEISKSENIIKTDQRLYAGYLNAYGLLFSKESLFIKAEDFFERAKEIYLNIEGEQSYSYLITCFSLALAYQSNAKLLEAENLLSETLVKWKILYSESDYIYANRLYDLSRIQRDKGNYSAAEKNALTCLDLLEKLNEKESSIYCYSLSNLGITYMHKGDFKNAEYYLNESITIANKVFGDKNIEYAKLLCDLASIYFEQANYIKAKELYLKAAVIIKERKGEQSEDYANVLNNLGSIYLKNIDYESADKVYIESLKIIENIYEKTHPLYATGITFIANLKSQTGDLDVAESYYLEALNICKIKLGESDPQYITSICNLATFYIEKYDYNKAEYFSQIGLEIVKKKYGENHPDFVRFLNTLGSFYDEIGNYNQSESYYLKALELTKKIYGENHPKTASCINNLAVVYIKNDLKKAEELLLVALELEKINFGTNHINYAISLNNLSQVYSNQSLNLKSLDLNTQALNIIKKTLGENCLEYASSLSFIGTDYVNLKDYSKAEKCYLKALNIRKNILGVNNPLSQLVESNLGKIYNLQNNDVEESKYLLSSFKHFKSQILEGTNFLSQFEIGMYMKKYAFEMFNSLDFLNRYPTKYPEINMGCYENELLVKNLSLRNQQRIKTSIQKSGDTLLQSKYEQFVANKKQLNKLQELPIAQRPTTYEQLTTETEQLEKELTRQSALFADAKNALSVTWKQVQEKLQPNEVAIDLVAFKYYNKKWTDSIVYAAFVVKKEFKTPKYIPLFEQKQLEFLLHKSKTESDSTSIDKQYTDKAISDLFLKPLEQDLKGCAVVYLSPAGLGHQINFKALPISDVQTFGEKYQVHLLGSTSELVNYKVAQLDKKTNLQLYLYGGINYNEKEETQLVTNSTENITALGFNEMITRSGITEFGYLGGTKEEVFQIATASKQNGFITTTRTETNATEESIKQLDGKTSPYVLHLATHGFFFSDPKKELPKTLDEINKETGKSKVYKLSDDPMMRSGLLFAGANKYWGKTSENQSEDDGILTASEISNLDLSACQLIVMSACETGLGEINGSEGVFGLQRAFKMAGVKNIIMSLWKVPDTQTAELFDIFYKACFSGKSIHEAFQIAQSEMKQKYSPYYWAGFVLLE